MPSGPASPFGAHCDAYAKSAASAALGLSHPHAWHHLRPPLAQWRDTVTRWQGSGWRGWGGGGWGEAVQRIKWVRGTGGYPQPRGFLGLWEAPANSKLLCCSERTSWQVLVLRQVLCCAKGPNTLATGLCLSNLLCT